jgi:multidrug resistance efflux pump
MPSASRLSPLLWLLGLLLLGGSVAGTGWALRRTDPGPGPATEESPDEEAEVAVCEGHADTESGVVALNPALPGRVLEVKVRENQEVAAGAVLLRVEDTLPRLRSEEAAAALESAQAQLTLAGTLREQYDRKLEQQQAAIRAAREAREAARQEADRQGRLSRSGLINSEIEAASRAHVKQLQAVLEAEEAKLGELRSHTRDPDLAVARARSEVAVARARWQQTRQAVEECTLRAPRAGRVLRLQAGIGDTLTVPPSRPALLFCPDEEVIVRAEVAQEFAAGVREGLPAVVQDDTGVRPAEWRGRVARVSDWFARQRSVLLEPGQLNDVRTLECIIRLSPEGRKDRPPLRIGQRVRVTILKQDRP